MKVISPVEKDNQVLMDANVVNWNRIGYDSAFVPGAQKNINNIAKYIELYKQEHKVYPLKIPQNNTSVDCFFVDLDFSYRRKIVNGVSGTPFYYEIIDKNKYYLGGVGKDGIIKTEDDLVPEINILEEKSTGLLKYKVVALPIMENAKQKYKQ